MKSIFSTTIFACVSLMTLTNAVAEQPTDIQDFPLTPIMTCATSGTLEYRIYQNGNDEAKPLLLISQREKGQTGMGAVLFTDAETYESSDHPGQNVTYITGRDGRKASDIDWSKEKQCFKMLDPSYHFFFNTRAMEEALAVDKEFSGTLRMLPNLVVNPDIDGCRLPYVRIPQDVKLVCFSSVRNRK